MGATKIINVLKDDRFEDLLSAFQKAEAEEVIFIFPKNTKLARKEDYFASLAQSAVDSEKQITIMTADQNIEKYANKYGFRFLAQTSKVKKTSSSTKKPPLEDLKEKYVGEIIGENDDESFVTEIAEVEPEESDTEDDTFQAELTMARAKSTSRKSGAKVPDRRIQKLESIWLKREGSDKTSKKSSDFWGGLSLIKKRAKGKNLNLIFLSSAVLVLAIVLFSFLGNAQVIIKPQKQKLDFELPVTVSTNTADIETGSNKIPGQFLSFKAEASKDFPVTGEEEVVRKARGEITVFNNFNSDPQNLVATTRFASSKGLIFRITRPITIPGAKLVNGKLNPGSVTVEVIADKPGQEYNINADRFTIPGFAGTPKFTSFYGESSQPMARGMIGRAKIVTEKDFNQAKEAVTKEALDKSLENLKNKTGNLQILEPINNDLVSLKSTAEIDDSTEGFAMTAVAETKTIGFSKDDLFQIIEGFINKNGNLMLLKDEASVDYKNVKYDFEKNILTFTVLVKGEAAARVNEDKLVEGLLGLKQNQIKDYLLGFKEIESARVVLSPFWVKTVPKNKQDIHVKIVY